MAKTTSSNFLGDIKFKPYWSATIFWCCCDDWLDDVLYVLMLRTKTRKNCAGGRLEVDLKQLAARPNQNKTTEKTEAKMFLQTWQTKKLEFGS